MRHNIRQSLRIVHRWLGLTTAIFLLLAGLTGSLLAWNKELDGLIYPALRIHETHAHKVRLDPLQIRDQLAQRYPGTQFNRVPLAAEPTRALVFDVAENTAAVATPRDFDQVFVHPFTGQILGTRLWGDISQGSKNLLPFIHRLHYSLALGTWGVLTLGIIALLWLINCVIGILLSVPAPSPQTQPDMPPQVWWFRWRKAWVLDWRSSYKNRFHLHIAGSLWLWAMLAVMAWSAVSFNLPQVYQPLMRGLFAHQPVPAAPRLAPNPTIPPTISWQQAHQLGRMLMAQQADLQEFSVIEESALHYEADQARYRYEVRSNLDINARHGATTVLLDAHSGALLSTLRPTGAAAGDTLHSWITGIHMARLGGKPFKALMSLVGIAVFALTLAGVLIYLRKRQSPARTEPA